MEGFDAVVVGGGHAGLAVSQHLVLAGVRHVVLERGRIGESWRSQRWDTFALNTPTWLNRLPGDRDEDVGEPADGFMTTGAWLARLEAYAARWDLPVREGVTVTSVEPVADDDRWLVRTEGVAADALETRSVIVASGIQNVPHVPAIAAALPPSIVQTSALEYRRPSDLPSGAVLVVGGGQTGGQITEDLVRAGRTVYLSPSRVARVRRRHRGRDILEWWVPAGFLEVTPEQLPDPALQFARQPIISGLGRYGHTVSLQ
jgi:putative flavoprotein involved in K+ transport